MEELSVNIENNIIKKSFKFKKNSSDGLAMQVHNNYQTPNGSSKQVRFIHSSFSPNDTYLALSDRQGNIFIVDLNNEEYWELQRVGIFTMFVFSKHKKDELLISFESGLIHFIKIGTGEVAGVLTGHSSAVLEASFTDDGTHCLTSSPDEAIVWDLETNSQAHKLTMTVDMLMKKVVFIPVSNNILSCFQDDSIQIWKFSSFECEKQLIPLAWNRQHITSIAFTKDGRAMVLAGHPQHLVVYCLDTWAVLSIIEVPEITSVKSVQFVPVMFDGGAHKVVAVTSHSSTVHLLDVASTTAWRLDIPAVGKFCVSEMGRYCAAVLHSGEVNIYMTSKLFVNKEVQAGSMTRRGRHSAVESPGKSTRTPRTSKSLESLKTIHKELQETISLQKLQPLLRELGEFPEVYRIYIWKNILQLPGNKEAYASLNKKQCWPAYQDIDKQYPLHNTSLLRAFKRLLSNLANWCPLFGEVSFLPQFVFPFVKVFHLDPMVCFEAVATILINFCQHWFEYYPFAPINVLSIVENVLSHHDAELMQFYYKQGVTARLYAWTLLSNVFSEVLTSKEWLVLWDHILSNGPAYLIMAAVSYNIVCRNAIRSCAQISDFELFFRNQNPIDLKKLTTKSYQLLAQTPEDIHPRRYLADPRPLTRQVYNMYSEYPKYVLDTRGQTLRDIQRDEKDLLKERKRILSLKTDLEGKLRLGRRTKLHEARSQKQEDTYRDVVDNEDVDRLKVYREKLQSLKRDLRIQELAALDKATDKNLRQRTQRRQAQLQSLSRHTEVLQNETDPDFSEEEEQVQENPAYKNRMRVELTRAREGDLGLLKMSRFAERYKDSDQRGKQSTANLKRRVRHLEGEIEALAQELGEVQVRNEDLVVSSSSGSRLPRSAKEHAAVSGARRVPAWLETASHTSFITSSKGGASETGDAVRNAMTVRQQLIQNGRRRQGTFDR